MFFVTGTVDLKFPGHSVSWPTVLGASYPRHHGRFADGHDLLRDLKRKLHLKSTFFVVFDKVRELTGKFLLRPS